MVSSEEVGRRQRGFTNCRLPKEGKVEPHKLKGITDLVSNLIRRHKHPCGLNEDNWKGAQSYFATASK